MNWFASLPINTTLQDHTLSINWVSIQIFQSIFVFFLDFLPQTLKIYRTSGKERRLRSFTKSEKFRHLFAVLHLRWLLTIFNRSACNRQTFNYKIRICLNISFVLFINFILLQKFPTVKQCFWSRIWFNHIMTKKTNN